MQLSRRDAIAALGALGIGASAVGTARQWTDESIGDEEITDRLQAAAEVVYPSAVDVDRSFIETVVRGRLNGRPEYVRSQEETLAALQRHSRRTTGRGFEQLDIDGRRSMLRQLGVPRAHPNPSGTVDERVRYYVVNDLLYVLFSTPTGGELVDCENPPGYPGGVEAYQHGPDA